MSVKYYKYLLYDIGVPTAWERGQGGRKGRVGVKRMARREARGG